MASLCGWSLAGRAVEPVAAGRRGRRAGPLGRRSRAAAFGSLAGLAEALSVRRADHDLLRDPVLRTIALRPGAADQPDRDGVARREGAGARGRRADPGVAAERSRGAGSRARRARPVRPRHLRLRRLPRPQRTAAAGRRGALGPDGGARLPARDAAGRVARRSALGRRGCSRAARLPLLERARGRARAAVRRRLRDQDDPGQPARRGGPLQEPDRRRQVRVRLDLLPRGAGLQARRRRAARARDDGRRDPGGGRPPPRRALLPGRLRGRPLVELLPGRAGRAARRCRGARARAGQDDRGRRRLLVVLARPPEAATPGRVRARSSGHDAVPLLGGERRAPATLRPDGGDGVPRRARASPRPRRTGRSATRLRPTTRTSDRLVPGTGRPGPRVLDFAPILAWNELPLVPALRTLLAVCEEELHGAGRDRVRAVASARRSRPGSASCRSGRCSSRGTR